MIHFFLENSNSELTTIHTILQKNRFFNDFQGPIQVLSKGGARFLSEPKNPDLGTKFFL